MPPKLFEAYERAVDNDVLASIRALIPGLVSCPHCPYTVELAPHINELVCRNPECRKLSCRHCQGVAHRGVKCEDVEHDVETKARKRIEEAMSRALLRTCSHCNASFSKESGCNKMTCKCGSLVCYICKSTIDKEVGYRHFKVRGADVQSIISTEIANMANLRPFSTTYIICGEYPRYLYFISKICENHVLNPSVYSCILFIFSCLLLTAL